MKKITNKKIDASFDLLCIVVLQVVAFYAAIEMQPFKNIPATPINEAIMVLVIFLGVVALICAGMALAYILRKIASVMRRKEKVWVKKRDEKDVLKRSNDD